MTATSSRTMMSADRGGSILHFDQPEISTVPQQRVLTRYRRNGKLQSCEPCRKSKLACDHVASGCGRCRRRRRDCFYHPAPLTQVRSPPGTETSSSETPRPPSTSETQDIRGLETIIPSTEATEPSFAGDVRRSYPWQKNRVHRAASEPCLEFQRRESVRGNQGFVGDTSYSVILAEGLRTNADLLPTDAPEAEGLDLEISKEKISRGCAVLGFLKDRALVERFTLRWYEMSEDASNAVIQSIWVEWFDALYQCHGETLLSQRPDGIRRLTETLWRNTRSPLVFDGKTTAREWARLASGANIRWEVIGLMAVLVGFCAKCSFSSDAILDDGQTDRPTLAKTMAEVSEACLSFCRDCEALDDLFVWLLMEYGCLVGELKGDNSFRTYRVKGELCSAMIAMGLHQKIVKNDKIPFFLAELRRRAFGFAYLMEISLASFLGRPPRLSYRYSVLDIPLDLTDEHLAMEREEDLQAALAGLDNRGFDTTRRNPGRITWLRAYFPFSFLREDILDLSLGHYSRDEILVRAESIRAAIDRLWDQLPESLAKAKSEPLDVSGSANDVLFGNTVRQGVRATELLLQRVLIRRTGARPDELVAKALAIFQDILAITSRHDIASMWQMEFIGMLVMHGLRSAAIISIELLRQEQMPVYPDPPLLPRSETIQQLAVFASRLASVDASSGNFGTCEQARRVITRILDRILTPGGCTKASDPRQVEIGEKVPGAVLASSLENGGTPLSVPGYGYGYSAPDMGANNPQDFTLGDLTLGWDVPQDQDFMQWLDGLEAEAWSNLSTL